MASKRKKDFKINHRCDFCLALQYEWWLIEERRERYNKAAHVKKAISHQGIIINNYVTDNHERVIEKHTKTFNKIRFCPMCGFNYIEGKFYDGREYQTSINEKHNANGKSTSEGE